MEHIVSKMSALTILEKPHRLLSCDKNGASETILIRAEPTEVFYVMQMTGTEQVVYGYPPEEESEAVAKFLKLTKDSRVPIMVTPEARKALREFLSFDADGTGEGFSQFILTAIEMRRKMRKEPR